ncbi:MAG: hypothetical protein JRF33_23770, partial [Deltaproteobacteria bacterium]|nr:hypothetical protein [Deltaproteobacteria bacterium]
VQQDLFNKLDKYVGNPPPGAKDGKGPGVKSRLRLGEDKIRVEIIVHVQQKMLQDDLAAMGVMQSTEDLMDSVGMPSLMAVPSKANKGSKLRGIMESIVNEYLSNQEFEILDAKGVQDLGKFTDALGEVSGAEENEAAQIAMAIGADVYFVYEAIKSKKGDTVNYTVRVKAYETTTGTVVGDTSATAPARYDDIAGKEAETLMEPMNDAMGKLVPLLMKFWKRTAPKGQRFYLVFNGGPEGTDENMAEVLERNCSKYKLVSSVEGKVILRAQCKMNNLGLAKAIRKGIKSKMEGAAFKWTAKTRTSLILQFQ